jgi:hypothetical protein
MTKYNTYNTKKGIPYVAYKIAFIFSHVIIWKKIPKSNKTYPLKKLSKMSNLYFFQSESTKSFTFLSL